MAPRGHLRATWGTATYSGVAIAAVTASMHKTYVIRANWLTGVMDKAAMCIQDLLATVGHVTYGGGETTRMIRATVRRVPLMASCVSVVR